MNGQILTFTNLFPSAARPRHGCFVQDRMARVAAHSGLAWQVVCPVPRVPALLRRGPYRVLAAEPPCEVVDGTTVHHVHYFHLPGLSLGQQARRIARACLPKVRELAAGIPTVLDAHYVYPDGVAAMQVAAHLGLPGVVTARGTDINVLAAGHAGVRRQLRTALAGAHRLLAVSDALRDRFAAVMGGAAVETARNGVDLQRFRPGDAAAARAALGLPATEPLILGVGRLVAGKGFQDAAAAIAARVPAAHLVLVGDGPCRARIGRLLPAGRVHFLGSRGVDDVVRAYQACDLLTLPSYREGWPNVVTEALACGLPVVACPVGGIPQILTDPGVSRLVPVGDVEALGNALAAFVADRPDPVQARTLAARYSWQETVESLCKLFRQALP